ncbi:MAG: hypothetical protein KAT77_04180 [Nanoarchaeota archaeon]|nr:hypothetical protein [Nanoarchaeota archaeon]
MEIKNKKIGVRKEHLIFLVFAVFIIIFGFYSYQAGIAGLFSSGENLISYEQDLNLEIEKDQEIIWELENHPEEFELKSVKLSGSYLGDRGFKIYLENDKGKRYLILDKKTIFNRGITKITGYAIAAAPPEEPPGQGGKPPGQGGEPPGQAKDKDKDEDKNKGDNDGDSSKEKTKKEVIKEFKKDKLKEKAKPVPKKDVEEHDYLIIDFKSLCAETCLLPPGFNQTTYKLIFRTISGDYLAINKISYVVENLTGLRNLTNVPYKKVKDDPNYEIIVNSAEMIENDLVVVFHHNSPESLPIKILGRLKNYTLDNDVSAAGENITLRIPNYQPKEFFRIKVGKKSEVLEFGEPAEFQVNTDIQDAQKQPISYDLELEDTTTEEVTLLEGGGNKTIAEGTYNIRIKPTTSTIKEIQFYDAQIYENISNFIDIDDVNETGELSNFIEVYAIDPSRFNFTNATVTVTAKGTSLYKCKDWNFSTQSCYGNWTLLKSDLIPGQDYTFTLTVADPGFGERDITSNLTSAVHLDIDRFIEVSVKEGVFYLADIKDNNKRFYLNFSLNLTNGSILNIFAKQDSGVATGIYAQSDTAGTNPFGIFTVTSATGDWYNITLSNFTTPTNAIWIGEGTGSGIDPKEYFDYFMATSPDENPHSITNLTNQSVGGDWIYWNWTNPSDSDFNESIVYLNGIWKINTSNDYYNATGLIQNTNYTITIHTKDTNGNINDTDINNTARTLLICAENWVQINESCLPSDTYLMWYNDSNSCGTTNDLPTDNGTYVACDYIISTEFEGTNFSAVNLSNIPNLFLKNSNYGMINFSESISINQSLDLNSNIEITNNSIFINSTALPAFNKSAVLEFYNLTFVSPTILRNGETCSPAICTRTSYVGGNLTFSVTHFTTYSSSEGPYCGDGSCNGDETCSSCAADCGSCPSSPSGSGGGGSSSVRTVQNETCDESWSCARWSDCVDEKQTRSCADENNCGTTVYKPSETKDCSAICQEQWACTEWGPCNQEKQIRVCRDANNCGTEVEKLEEIRDCSIAFCFNGIKDNNETGIDCGGVCGPCPDSMISGKTITIIPETRPNPIFALPAVLAIILLIFIIALRKDKLSKKTRKILTIVHISIIILIFGLVMASFQEIIKKYVPISVSIPLIIGIVVIAFAVSLLIFTLHNFFMNKKKTKHKLKNKKR